MFCKIKATFLNSFLLQSHIKYNDFIRGIIMKFQSKFAMAIALASSLTLTGCSLFAMSTATTLVSTGMTVGSLTLQSNRMMNHLNQFQNIAESHQGNRATGTKGGEASAQYILDHIKKTGYEVQIIAFENRDKVIGQNILVEIKGKDQDHATLIGAHYDSVKMGPGINDNASGTALLMDFIEEISSKKIQPEHSIYVAFWDSEEQGIAGSQAYAEHLTEQQLKAIKAYINVDMVGTKDPEILIADADKSSVDEMEKQLQQRGMSEQDYKPLLDGLRKLPSHTGDQALEDELKTFFKSKNLKIKEDVSTLTASDTAAFLGKVPVASLILFHEQMKGDVLEFAPCYHTICDRVDTVDPKSMQLAAEALVHLVDYVDHH